MLEYKKIVLGILNLITLNFICLMCDCNGHNYVGMVMILHSENSSHANSSYLNFVVVEILFI